MFMTIIIKIVSRVFMMALIVERSGNLIHYNCYEYVLIDLTYIFTLLNLIYYSLTDTMIIINRI